MEKKTYMAPQVELIESTSEQQLLNWSADKAEDGNDTPEAKEDMFGNEDGWNTGHGNLWDD